MNTGVRSDVVVFKEKLRAPEAGGLARARLEKSLLDGKSRVLDLVVAPAGSGKTTLLSRVAHAGADPVGWYRVTDDDVSERRFVAHLAAALRPICGPVEGHSVDAVLTALDDWSGPHGMVILDDLHEIAETSAERALQRFVTLRPRRLQVVLGSRRVPDINISRLRVSGPLLEIGNDDLRFRTWEVEELFAKVHGRPLRPEAAAALTRRTGGWAAGLQLFHLATTARSAAERHQAVSELGGRSKLIRSYLTRNVLRGLPEDRRVFLLRTCALGRLSGQACDALLNIGASHRILEDLERAQLFTSTDDDGVHFRYHEVLQSHLELALVEEYGPDGARRWYARSGVVLESLGDLRAATRAFAKAEDWVAVSRLLRQAGGHGLGEDLLPPATFRRDAWLGLANARRLVRDGALQAAWEAYRFTQSCYDEPRFSAICAAEAQAVAAWLPTARGSGGRHWSRILRDGLRAAPDVCVRGPADAEAGVRLARGLAALVAGERAGARESIASVRGDESAGPAVSIAAELAWQVLDVLGGEVAGDAAHAFEDQDVAVLAEVNGLPWLARLAHGLQQVALARPEDATWRLNCCGDLIAACDARGDVWGAALLSLAVGLRKRSFGMPSPPELADAATRLTELDAPMLARWCEARCTAEPKAAAAVRIRCFGEFHVDIDGVRADVTRLRPQARNVLQLLALAPGVDHHREFLEDVLWPGVSHTAACHRLQVAVSSVRSLLEDGAVTVQRRGEAYRLALPPHSTVDVADFRAALAAAATASAKGDVDGRMAARRRALALYGGDLLPGVHAEPVDGERQRLRRAAASAAASLAADHRARGDGGEALAAAQLSVDLDPYQDGPWLLMAELHESGGDTSAAELTRREHARLQAELTAGL
ncbi:transcriptional regulator [Mycobacterium sp. PS03-16]|uniref:BTAD domain-containing putative transcriptional regulator n=1 Tax=Mycobacterium sp. PS03-16 TaxID=2559611 RepID=UPI00107333E0|nr:BTAD domain-containing putative transcriptional regulator [Mycobacterium sp. PS03-16]TFV61588.1 transcriptional regulator [Mycobacterium sp. PS03-16]